jgi:voltage-dependent potassium channel beta subunit
MPNAQDMTYRPLGRCGTKVSALGLGGWLTFGGSVKESLTGRVIRRAFDEGVNFFDIADVYAGGEAERVMGKALADLPRHELVVSSKCYWPMSEDVNDRGLSRKHVIESVNASLRRIGTDYLDLFFCHRYDPETPVEETVRALDDLVRAGKVLYWGTSEWTGEQLREAHRVAREAGAHRPQVEQPQYSLAARAKVEQDVEPAARELGMGLVTWSPLASGLLTGKYDDGVPDDSRLGRVAWLRESTLTDSNLRRVRSMAALAKEAGCSRAQLAIAWVMSRPSVASVILGATSLAQLEENLAAAKLALDPDLARRLDELFAAG